MSNLIQNIIWFIVLIILQVLIFNNINLFGYINPLFYIIFIFYFPLKKEKTSLLLFSFFLGLSIDFFSDTGGINTAATLFIAYFRLPILSTILGKSDFDYLLFNIRSLSFAETKCEEQVESDTNNTPIPISATSGSIARALVLHQLGHAPALRSCRWVRYTASQLLPTTAFCFAAAPRGSGGAHNSKKKNRVCSN